MKKAVILVSGGLDSTTTLAMAIEQGYDVYPITFSYGQKHEVEIKKAMQAVEYFKIKNHKVINLDLRAFGGSALTDSSIEIPKYKNKDELGDTIPVTYVPARNTIFLSLALAYAETINAYDIFIGVHAQDYSNYPDCRPEFIKAFEDMANLGVKYTSSEKRIRIHIPIIEMNKAQIIEIGTKLGVDYKNTISCYDASADGLSCGTCHPCLLRKDAFEKNNILDPTLYR